MENHQRRAEPKKASVQANPKVPPEELQSCLCQAGKWHLREAQLRALQWLSVHCGCCHSAFGNAGRSRSAERLRERCEGQGRREAWCLDPLWPKSPAWGQLFLYILPNTYHGCTCLKIHLLPHTRWPHNKSTSLWSAGSGVAVFAFQFCHARSLSKGCSLAPLVAEGLLQGSRDRQNSSNNFFSKN